MFIETQHNGRCIIISEEYLSHSAKGTTWKNHKYIKKETKNGKTTYSYAGNKTAADKKKYMNDMEELYEKAKQDEDVTAWVRDNTAKRMTEAKLNDNTTEEKRQYDMLLELNKSLDNNVKRKNLTEQLYLSAKQDYDKTITAKAEKITNKLKDAGKKFTDSVKDVGDEVKEKAEKGKDWIKSLFK